MNKPKVSTYKVTRPHWARVVRENVSEYEKNVLQAHMDSSIQIAEALVPRLGAETQEVFVVVCLNGENRALCLSEVARGGTSGCNLHCIQLFRLAVMYTAAAIVLVHNHPSGDPTPSPEDIVTTRTVVAYGKALEIDVVDHVIIAGTRHTSMLDLGLMPKIRDDD